MICQSAPPRTISDVMAIQTAPKSSTPRVLAAGIFTTSQATTIPLFLPPIYAVHTAPQPLGSIIIAGSSQDPRTAATSSQQIPGTNPEVPSHIFQYQISHRQPQFAAGLASSASLSSSSSSPLQISLSPDIPSYKLLFLDQSSRQAPNRTLGSSRQETSLTQLKQHQLNPLLQG